MADRSSSPLLGESAASRPSTRHSDLSHESHENTPLLSQANESQRYDGEENHAGERYPSPAASSLRSLQNGGGSHKSSKGGRRLPTFIAIFALTSLMVAIVVGVFFAPAIVEEYAKESVVVEPTNLSIHEITSTGVVARVQANFRLDASKVKSAHVRNIGRFGTWVAKKVETSESTIKIYAKTLDLLLGSVVVPKIVVDIRNGHANTLDFLTDVRPGDINGLRQLANDWLDGRIHDITVRGEGDIGVKSGLFNLGTQKISEEMHFEGSDVPALPQYNITRLNVYEQPIPSGGRGMAADVQISLVNEYPLGITVPPLAFDIFVPDCNGEPVIRLADATSGEITIKPHSDVIVNAGGLVRELPKLLTKACPGSSSSPLDIILGDYLDGKDAKLFVRGSSTPSPSTPEWISKIMSSITVPVPFPGRTFDNLVKEFHLDNTSFNLPSPFADEGDDDANPRISSDITVVAGMPKDMNFGVNVTRLSATADVYYKKKMMGVLDMSKWQQSSSKRLALKDGFSDLQIQSHIVKAPLRIKDEDVFEDVISAFYFGKGVELLTKARLTFEVSTVLGNFIVRDMPAEATVPIKPPIKGGNKGLPPLHTKMHDLSVTGTTKTALNLQVKVDFTNPTNYSAVIPYFNLHILHNNSIIGDATVRNQLVTPGNVTDFTVQVSWDPAMGGEKGQAIGRELLSQYISGYNTTLTVKLHEKSIAHQPELGKMLSKYSLTVPWPRVSNPNPETGKEEHLIRDATFHVLSKTAQFTLVSPFSKSTIFIDHMNATALYNHTETIGRIIYDLPFMVPPGVSQSPRLPVDVDGSGMGFPELKKAIGGNLKLDARGIVTVRLGQWTERVWYVGEGIGSSIRL